MNRRRTLTLATTVVLGATPLALAPLTAGAATTPAAGSPRTGASAFGAVSSAGSAADKGHRKDDLPSAQSNKQRALITKAVRDLATGKTAVTTNKKGKKVIKVAKGQYVNYDVNREEDIFTILVEFGNRTKTAQGGTPGPVHNQIPKPNRTDITAPDYNNTTIWQADYNRQHYYDLMFGATDSFKDFYLKQSNGRFLAKGDVSDWVQVPYNEARYGHNPVEGDGTSEAEGSWSFIADTAQAWYDAQKKAGKSDAQIAAYLKQFDKVDRYDYDHDGDFNEPDGYIDHFQAIHAGEGEEAGGGAEGADAIWSHRWYAFSNGAGKSGPTTNKLGGTQIGNSGIWIGDYTTEPENGGLGVFTHEFGHDLGLPDLYDTQGGDNGTGFWTLMSGGSWLGDGTQDIGSKPGYMGPWEKLFLGWLDYQRVPFGQNTKVKLGPADRAAKNMAQALIVNLPDQQRTREFTKPHAGSSEWWSGTGDNLTATLSRVVDLTAATTASLSTWISTDTEEGYDFAYVEASADGGASWTTLKTLSGTTPWTQYTVDLSQFAGKQVTVRVRYASDGGKNGTGVFVDDTAITVDGKVVLTDGAENGDNGWTATGFTRMSGTVTDTVPHFYLAENRVYSGYDQYLKTGPYNFGWGSTQPDRVEHFPYQNGLLVWYSNGMCDDNNTSVHPGCGLVLPVDARPTPLFFSDGAKLGNRRQPWDATFGLEATDPVTFHHNGVPLYVPSQPAIPTFDDSDPNRYWSAANPWSSTKVAGSGTRMTVHNMAKQGDQMNVDVTFTK